MLEINNLTVKYGNKIVIKDQSLVFDRGVVTAIKGKSGSGKSSLLNVLGLLRTIDDGYEYKLDGNKIDYKDEKKAAEFRLKHIGFIFQSGNLIDNLSVRDNILLPSLILKGNDDGKRADELIEYAGLSHIEKHFPEEISGGEIQRTAAIRALMNDCDIILADEPTASLDSENAAELISLLIKLAHEKGKIVIIVSHDDKVCECCDRILKLEDGRFAAIKEDKREIRENTAYKKIESKHRWRFIPKYDKKRRRDKKDNGFLLCLTTLIISITALSFGFGRSFENTQRNLAKSVSDICLYVYKDSTGMGINAQPYDGYEVPFSDDEVEAIRKIGPKSVDPFYFMTSSARWEGKTEECSSITIEKDGKVIAETDLKDHEEYKKSITENSTFVFPLYSGENADAFLEDYSKKELSSEGIYVGEKLAKYLVKNPENLVGTTAIIRFYVPVATLKRNIETMSSGGKIYNDMDEYFFGYKLVEITKKIEGIVDEEYKYERFFFGPDQFYFLINNDELMRVIDENKGNYQDEMDWEIVDFGSQLLIMHVDSYEELERVSDEIGELNPDIKIVNYTKNKLEFAGFLDRTRKMIMLVSIIMLVIVMVIFSVVYYLKNRERKQEVGILKAMGLDSKGIFKVVAYDMAKRTLWIFLSSVVISYLISLMGFFFTQTDIFIFDITTIFIILILSLIVVFVSGMLSVYKVSRMDVIDAIRLNN